MNKDDQLQLEVLGDDGTQEAERLHIVNCGQLTLSPQVVLAAQSHQMVNFLSVGGLISTRDMPNEGGVICELQ